MIVGGQTEARAQLSSTIIDYHEPFDQGLTEGNSKYLPLRPGFSKYVKLGHLTLLFGRERQRNVQRLTTHVHSYCFAH